MKPNLKIFTILLLMATSCVVLPRQMEAQQTTISLQVFYDELSPYGQWIDYIDYGYVWIPNAEPDFVPYSSDGHWILTEYGWTWSSDYDWGWAAFHYGRWSFDNSFGWFWVPDNQWGPAWVNWRQYNEYYGWSPMEPGISLSISFRQSYDSNNDHWLFIRDRDFERSDMNRYYVGRSDRDRMVRNSTIIKRTYVDRTRNTTYVSGPSRESVQQATGRTISPVSVRENNKPGQNLRNGQLEIYRPRIEKDNAGRKTSPTRVTTPRDVKRNQGNRPATQTIDNRNKQNNGRPSDQNKVNAREYQNRNNQNNEPVKTTPTDINRPIRQPNKVDIQNNQPSQQQNTVRPANDENKSQQNKQQKVRQSNNNKPSKEERSVNQRVKEEQTKTPDQETNKR